MGFMFMTNKELDARIDYAVQVAIEEARLAIEEARLAKLRQQRYDYLKDREAGHKSPLSLLSERVASLEADNRKLVAEAKQSSYDYLELRESGRVVKEEKVVVKDLKLRCGTPVFYEQAILGKGVSIKTATVQQYIADVNMYIIELCGTGELCKVPLKSLIRIQKEGAK